MVQHAADTVDHAVRNAKALLAVGADDGSASVDQPAAELVEAAHSEPVELWQGEAGVREDRLRASHAVDRAREWAEQLERERTALQQTAIGDAYRLLAKAAAREEEEAAAEASGGSPAIDAGDLLLMPGDLFDLDGDQVSAAEPWPFDYDGAARVSGVDVDLGPYEAAP